jgi:hypothetical protein
VFGFLKRRRRARLRAQPIPPEWREIVKRNVPLFRRLPPEDGEELLRKVRVFLAEKRFEGCGGLELTDEMRVTVAAQACLPILKLDDDYYPRLRSILVYPDTFVARRERREGAVVHEGHESLLGESWQGGAVVLSWASVRAGAANPLDGENVVLHEFAHQLDQEDGAPDGTPVLHSWSAYGPWARVLSEDYLELRESVAKGREELLDAYGATDEAEFFAVASQTFFEKPVALEREHPELYDQLRAYYRQDPAALLSARPEKDA